jgi:hypothetical protein
MFAKVRKAVGAFLGAATAAGVVQALEFVDISVSVEVAGALAVALATVGTWLTKPNEV